MILTLVREQMRAQRTALMWTAIVLAGAVGFSTYATVTGATQASVSSYTQGLRPENAPHGAFVQLTDLAIPAVQSSGPGTATTTAALEQLLAQSNEAGSDAWAAASEWGTLGTVDGKGLITAASQFTIMATWGATPWNTILAQGHAPLEGQIVLPAGGARELGISIGDSVEVLRQGPAGALEATTTLTVAGLAYDAGGFTPWSSTPAYINGTNADVVADLASPPGSRPNAVVAIIGWSTAESVWGTVGPVAWEQRGGPALMTPNDLAPWLVAITLTLGTAIMAFAVGRTQAASRVQWTATARALGARRSHLLGAGAVEGAVLFVMALVGGGLGYGAAVASHAGSRRSLAAPPPVDVTMPWWLIASLVGLALVLAATSAAIPAVLATRVPPTAALKATSTIDEQELSRRVPIRPVGLGLAAALIALLVPIGSDSTVKVVWTTIACAGFVLLAAFVVEMARRGAEAAGRRWQRSDRPWLIYAGTMLGGHPRQAAALASIHFFALFGVAGWLASKGDAAIRGLDLLDGYSVGNDSARVYELIVTTFGPAAMGMVVAVCVLCGAIIASSFRAATAARKLAGALGLAPRDVKRAHIVTWASAQLAGALAGALAGTVLMGSIVASQSADDVWGFVGYDVAGRAVAFAASIGVALIFGLFATVASTTLANWLAPSSSASTPRLREVAR